MENVFKIEKNGKNQNGIEKNQKIRLSPKNFEALTSYE